MRFLSSVVLLLLSCKGSEAFLPRKTTSFVGRTLSSSTAAVSKTTSNQHASRSSSTKLQMGLDLVTYLRTEWVSAALCTNQTPRAADVVLQLGCEDGRIVTFIPRTVRELITSSLEKDGKLTLSCRRTLKQNQDRRGAAKVTFVDQRADDLRETKDESVDVVVSLQAAQRMLENGLDWKKSIREAARVLKPGGKLLFVEQTEIEGESYLEYIETLMSLTGDVPEDAADRFPIFDDGTWDPVDLVIVPHIAGVATKSMDAGLTPEERTAKKVREEQERMAELSIEAYERGIKRRRKKKKVTEEAKEEAK